MFHTMNIALFGTLSVQFVSFLADLGILSHSFPLEWGEPSFRLFKSTGLDIIFGGSGDGDMIGVQMVSATHT